MAEGSADELLRLHKVWCDRYRAMLAECFRLSGADPDQGTDHELAERAVEEVRRLRDELDAADDHIVELERGADPPDGSVKAAAVALRRLAANNARRTGTLYTLKFEDVARVAVGAARAVQPRWESAWLRRDREVERMLSHDHAPPSSPPLA